MHNGPLAGLVAICAGSDVMHPIGALVTGVVAGALFVVLFTLTQNRWQASTTCSASGRCTACAARGAASRAASSARRRWAASAASRSARSSSARCSASLIALVGGAIVYGVLKATMGIRLDPEEEFNGADLAIHKISATAERETAW